MYNLLRGNVAVAFQDEEFFHHEVLMPRQMRPRLHAYEGSDPSGLRVSEEQFHPHPRTK
jgi:hypothetical protein